MGSLKKALKSKLLIRIIFFSFLSSFLLLIGLHFLNKFIIDRANKENKKITLKVKKEIEDFILNKLEKSKLKKILFIKKDENILKNEEIKNELRQQLKDLINISKNTISIKLSDFFDTKANEHKMLIAIPKFKNNDYLGTEIFEASMKDLFSKIKNIVKKQNIIIVKNKNDKIIPIIPQNNNFKSLLINKASPLYQALNGNFDTHLDNESGIITSSAHMISLNWTMIIQKNIQNKLIAIKILYFLFLAIFILSALFLLMLILTFDTNLLPSLTFILFLISIFSISHLFRKYTKLSILNREKQINEKYIKVNNITSLIQSNLNNIKNTVYELEVLLENNISEEAARKLLESKKNIDIIDFIEIIYFDKEKESKLYADSTSILYPTTSKIIDSSKYTQEEWYKNAIKKEGWSNTQYNNDQQPFLRYTKPIFDQKQKKVIGLISAAYLLSDLQAIVPSPKFHDQDKGNIIFNSNGDIILFSELNDNSNKKINIQDLSNYGKFHNLDKVLILSKKQGLGILEENKHKIFYSKIPGSNWIFADVYNKSYFYEKNMNIFKILMLIILNIGIAFLLFLLFILSSIKLTTRAFIFSSIFISIALILLSLSMIFKLYRYQTQSLDGNEIIDQELISSLKKAKSKGIKPNIIKTGIYVKNIDPNDDNKFQANLWQKKPYNKKNVGLEIYNATLDNFQINEVFNNKEKIGWRSTGNLLPSHEKSFGYPFDKKILKFILKPLNKNINDLFVVDINSYKRLNPTAKPGVNPKIKINNFSIKKSYFTYFNDNSNFGDNRDDKKYLTLNIEIGRDLANSFLLYFLPLLIIIIAALLLSATSTPNRDNDFRRRFIFAYTSLLFSLILVHQNLRRTIKLIGLSYAELVMLIVYLLLVFCYIELFVPIKNKTYFKLRPFILGFSVSLLLFIITFTSFYFY